MKKEGWFHTPGRLGDRTIDEQWLGLGEIDWAGKSVLDLGAAEGLVLKRAKEAGAAPHSLGAEIVEGHVEVARRNDVPVICADLNHWNPSAKYDIVLMLAILHKLKRPLERLALFAEACAELAVIRLPPANGPVIVDERSGFVPYDTRPVMLAAGFVLEHDHCDGPKGEYMAYWRRA